MVIVDEHCANCNKKISPRDACFMISKAPGDTYCSKSCMEAPHDPVNHPPHYNSHPSGVECVEITRHYSCMIGAAMKYLWRAGLKEAPDCEDYNKAIWCIMEEINRLGGEVTAKPRNRRER